MDLNQPLTDPTPETSPELVSEQAVQADAGQAADGQGVATPAKASTIGVFDSGIGGFTVAGAILKLRPDLNLIYYADSLNLPYGARSVEQLARFGRHTIEFLLEHGAGILAVGCNASNSALGQGELRSYGVPVFDLVGSTVDWLRERPKQPDHIALLATEATLRARYWERKLTDAFPGLRITPIAAPDLVPLIEAHPRDDDSLRAAVRRHTEAVRACGATTLLLGCTHYPLIQGYFVEQDVYLSLIDPAQCLAERLVGSLPPAAPDAPPGELRLFNSLPGEQFHAAAERIFCRPTRALTSMFIVNAYED